MQDPLSNSLLLVLAASVDLDSHYPQRTRNPVERTYPYVLSWRLNVRHNYSLRIGAVLQMLSHKDYF